MTEPNEVKSPIHADLITLKDHFAIVEEVMRIYEKKLARIRGRLMVSRAIIRYLERNRK